MKCTCLLGLALFQPDIPGNFGASLRLAACLGVALDVIEPAAFAIDDRRIRRAALDYAGAVVLNKFADFDRFVAACSNRGARIVLMTTRGSTPLHRFMFRSTDVVLVGRESAGVPPDVHSRVDATVFIPMIAEARSLNVHVAASLALYEGLKQNGVLDGYARSKGPC